MCRESDPFVTTLPDIVAFCVTHTHTRSTMPLVFLNFFGFHNTAHIHNHVRSIKRPNVRITSMQSKGTMEKMRNSKPKALLLLVFVLLTGWPGDKYVTYLLGLVSAVAVITVLRAIKSRLVKHN